MKKLISVLLVSIFLLFSPAILFSASKEEMNMIDSVFINNKKGRQSLGISVNDRGHNRDYFDFVYKCTQQHWILPLSFCLVEYEKSIIIPTIIVTYNLMDFNRDGIVDQWDRSVGFESSIGITIYTNSGILEEIFTSWKNSMTRREAQDLFDKEVDFWLWQHEVGNIK